YGRYREFYQCDVDIVGCESILADAEIISIIVEALETFEFEEFQVRINNRKLLKAMMRYAGVSKDKVVSAITACDKLSKLGFDGVRRELIERGISQKSIEKIFKVMGIEGENFKILEKFEILIEDDSEGVEGILELRELLNYLKALGVDERFLRVDMSLARALDYYTGPIYETYVTKPKIGSLTGGGRYDELLFMFGKKKLPATGTTIGIERIIDVLKRKGFGKRKTLTRVLITYTEKEMLLKACEIARDLWERQIDAELYINPLKKLRKQFEYANKRGIERVIIVGPRDLKKNQITLREMVSGKERKLELEKLYDLLKRDLN
ncbi:MAG: histidine--tRNA ligase, partial [Candidatus Methanofastidiosia archaeon]